MVNAGHAAVHAAVIVKSRIKKMVSIDGLLNIIDTIFVLFVFIHFEGFSMAWVYCFYIKLA